jgi:DNA-binding MarR family transcriptional regulator
MDREWLIDEILMLSPVLARGLGRPRSEELAEIAAQGIPLEVHISPGHAQVLIALGRGPHSMRQLAETLGVSSPAVTQLVNHLEEHKMVERRHDPDDRRVVLVDYAPGMQDIAHRMMEGRRRRIGEVVDSLADEEARALLKGLRSLIESLGAAHKEGDAGELHR